MMLPSPLTISRSLDLDGNFLNCPDQSDSTLKLIEQTSESVLAEAIAMREKLKAYSPYPLSSRCNLGFELMIEHIKDLLGRNTPAAKIFQQKIENE
jgi:hypothetical protein